MRWLLPLLLLAACGVPLDGDLDPCGFAPPAAALIDLSVQHDAFRQRHVSAIDGLTRDGVDPAVHEVVLEEGAAAPSSRASGPATRPAAATRSARPTTCARPTPAGSPPAC